MNNDRHPLHRSGGFLQQLLWRDGKRKESRGTRLRQTSVGDLRDTVPESHYAGSGVRRSVSVVGSEPTAQVHALLEGSDQMTKTEFCLWLTSRMQEYVGNLSTCTTPSIGSPLSSSPMTCIPFKEKEEPLEDHLRAFMALCNEKHATEQQRRRSHTANVYYHRRLTPPS